MIGTEYLGLPLPAKLEEMVVSVALPGVHLMWYLDIYKWKWRRLLLKTKVEPVCADQILSSDIPLRLFRI